jgi:hypothetical protein
MANGSNLIIAERVEALPSGIENLPQLAGRSQPGHAKTRFSRMSITPDGGNAHVASGIELAGRTFLAREMVSEQLLHQPADRP